MTSLAELHREVEFYERPDRPAIVRDVYERFRQQSGPEARPVVPPPLLEPPPPKRYHRWWRRKSFWVGSAIVLLTMAVGAAVWAWPRPEGRWLRRTVQQAAGASLSAGRRAASAVRRQVDSGKRTLGSRVSQPDRSVLVLAPPESPRTPLSGDRISVGAPAQPPPVQAFELAQAPLAGQPQVPPAPLSGELSVARAGVSGVAGGAVFSATDSQVVPPRLANPRSMPGAAQGGGSQGPAEVELLVSPTGEVETVKVLSGQTTALSAMQISAIKAWRFQPATRGGEPVRYRLRMRIPNL